MTYKETLDWLFAQLPMYQREGQAAYKANLDNTLKLDAHFQHPHHHFKSIHVAGTNGKGSVSHMLASILQEAGYKTGLYTSPHLKDFRERIKVNGQMIGEDYVTRFVSQNKELFATIQPSFFEMTVAMAFKYFADEQADIAVIEVGLGGRLDSTNIITPLASVITNISFDHMALLGDTLPKIAAEKAGIIKHGTALVLESQEKEAMDVLNKAAERADIKTTKVVNLDEIRILPQKDGKQCFSYAGYDAVTMKMLGVHQYENAVAAMLAAELFFEKYFAGKKNVPERKALQHAIREGIDRTQWMGRMELVSNDPFFLMDGAHNSNGVEALKKSLETMYPDEKFHFIMGVMADKDYGEMIRELLPLALDFKTVTVESERALQGEALADCIRAKGIPAEAYQNLADVLPDFSKSSAEKTVAFGSLYFIGEIEAFLRGKQ